MILYPSKSDPFLQFVGVFSVDRSAVGLARQILADAKKVILYPSALSVLASRCFLCGEISSVISGIEIQALRVILYSARD